MLSGATLNPFRVRHIEGVCNALPAGIVEVGFHVGYCKDYSYNADAHSGWNSVSRIYVEEIPPPQQSAGHFLVFIDYANIFFGIIRHYGHNINLFPKKKTLLA